MINKRALLIAGLAVGSVACRHDMHDQPKYKPLQESEFFADRRSERPALEGTVARGHARIDQALYVGKVNGADVTAFPFAITLDDIKRGKDRFEIYCTPCHSRLGDGEGQVVRRGFRQPPSYHTQKLKDAPVGHFFDVMTNGFGSMPSYASRVTVDDRWRIIAYIRALQLSQGAALADVPADKQSSIQPAEAQQPGVSQPTNEPPANPAAPPDQGAKK